MSLVEIKRAVRNIFFHNEGRDNKKYFIPKGGRLVYNEGGDNKYHVLRRGEVLAFAEGHDNKYHAMSERMAKKMGFRH
ncbi:MAG TPA: hypothetical protein PK526_04055 [bacterium]|nr:hypothetical protein [bacterium]